MPRPPLPIESWGRISTSIDTTDDKGKPLGFRAKARFRDHDGDGSRRLAPFEVSVRGRGGRCRRQGGASDQKHRDDVHHSCAQVQISILPFRSGL
jgi:hypothetical protein